ncbi:Fc.00g016270.m01.CDS01 [Cosmosporella sp. VM-42]
MPPIEGKSHGNEPSTSATGHPLPRRASPANSVTLRHHRVARAASLRASSGSTPANQTDPISSPRRNSSGESHDTGQSDPKKWFDRSNENPMATFDNGAMDVDPPFFQKESDSSNEEKPYQYEHLAPPKLRTAQSSSADDYRSVIDDLTVEIQRLKEELKKYKQLGPDMLRKEKLFEVKVHGLTGRKKRELEATLRDFTASLQGSPDTSSTQKKNKLSRHATRDRMYSASGSMSKHASSSSGSNFRPTDSAYASMSTGANSSGTSLGRPSASSRAKSSELKVENYLRDIPEGLYPRHMIMTDKERKKLVVRRLEQIFTGKIGSRQMHKKSLPPPTGTNALAPVMTDTQSQVRGTMHQPPNLQVHIEPSREARILPVEQQSGTSGKKNGLGDNGSASNSHEEQIDSGANGNSTSSGTNPSPLMPPPPEQRPTRPKDLDPDRVQVPSENMDYIRHLGLIPPELLAEQHKAAPEDFHPDADGWVYLNLLCNLAQLHMINVTQDFVRSAVSEISTKFQLSPDGRKIRWRGGTEGTRFSSDSSGYNSQRSPSTDETDGSNKVIRKRQKTGRSTGDEFRSGSSGKYASKFGQQVSVPSENFHYKPLFVHHDSFNGQTSVDETVSSFGPVEDSNVDDSRWGLSGSGNTSSRKKRRHDGAIIYYSGAPFCTDLSGDAGDVSPATYMMSSAQSREPCFARSPPRRSNSGSSLNYKPLTEKPGLLRSSSSMDIDSIDSPPDLTRDDADDPSDIELDFTWSDEQQYMELQPLEPCGLGGVRPDDHFMVVVTTKRPKDDPIPSKQPVTRRPMPEESTDGLVRRLSTMSTGSPALRVVEPVIRSESPQVEIEYMSGRIKRLAPAPLPPPAIFFPPLSTDDSMLDYYEFGSEVEDSESSAESMSRHANPHQSDDYPDGVDLSSADEDGDDPDDFPVQQIYDPRGDVESQTLSRRRRRSSFLSSSAAAAAGTMRGNSKSTNAEVLAQTTDRSSIATAGGVGSGYSSSEEDSP